MDVPEWFRNTKCKRNLHPTEALIVTTPRTVPYLQTAQGAGETCPAVKHLCLPKLSNLVVFLILCAGRHPLGSIIPALRWLHARAGDVQQQAPIESAVRPWTPGAHPKPRHPSRPATCSLEASGNLGLGLSASLPLSVSTYYQGLFGLLPSSLQIFSLDSRSIIEHHLRPTEKMDPTEQPPPPPAAPPSSTPDAPDSETMEQIRQRRLAKLGGPPGSRTPGAGSPRSGTPSAPEGGSSRPTENKTTPSEAGKPAPVDNNRPQINISPAPAATPQSTGSASSSRPGITNDIDSRTKRRASDIDGPSVSAPPRKQPVAAQETIEDYADRVLSAIFRFTVDPNRTTDAHGHKLHFLSNLSQELADEGLPLKLPADRLDEAILEAATAVPPQRPVFEYLLPCWKRLVKTLKVFRGPAPDKEALLKEARRLCFSNCIFSLTVPELFG